MSDELNDYDEQLQEIINSMRTCLDTEVAKLTGPARLEKCDYLKQRLNRARTLVKTINVEMRELPADKRTPYIEKCKVHETTLAKLQQDINWAITSAERDSSQGKTAKGVDEMTGKELTAAAIEIQNQSLQATGRTKQVIQATIQLGTETMDVMKQQTEQINNIHDNVDQIESNLKRADKQLRAFLRKMATDRIIMLFVFLIVLGIIGAVVVGVLKPGTKLSNSIPHLSTVNGTIVIVQGSS
ncbi:hypothetical protein RI367_005652 [Sorochytrium milnesiophthora]